MCQFCGAVWVLSVSLLSSKGEAEINSTQPGAVNFSQPRALIIEDKQDVSSYFPYQQVPSGPYPPPSYSPPPTYGPPPTYSPPPTYVPPYAPPPPPYGPPPPPLPQGMVHIEFAFDEIVLRCVAEEPFEHIVWNRYQCPQQFLFGSEGVHVADGSNVQQNDLYDVHIRGHDGTIVSELLIKNPLAGDSEGIYQCEVWPHIHSGGGYYPFNPYQNYNPPKSEVFIIGGNSLLEECYHVSNLGSPSKINGISNKHITTNNDQDIKENFIALKPRRNITESRKDSNSKQLRYNLKYVNNSLYNVEGVNVTADFFHPSKIPLNLQNLHNNISNAFAEVKTSHNVLNTDNFVGRNNDKFRKLYPKFNVRRGKITANFSNLSEQETD